MGERSVAGVIEEIVRNVQEIFGAEIRLAKAELREEASEAAKAATLLAVGATSALYAGGMLLVAAGFALASFLPIWAGFLLVALAIAPIAAVLISAGRKRLSRVDPKPKKTIETMKENVRWASNLTKSNDTSNRREGN